MAVQLTKVSSLSPLSDLNHTLANTDVVYAAVNSSALSSAKVTMSQVGDFIGTYGSPFHTAVVTNSATWTASIDGSGTTNYIPKFTGSSAIGNSVLYDDGDQIIVNGTIPHGTAKLTVSGSAMVNGAFHSHGAITSDGDITAFSSSDERLKDEIEVIPDALNKVNAIDGVTFIWNDKSDKEGNDVGVLAQQVEEVLPEVVVTRDNGYKAVKYEKVIPLLVQAIKELTEKVNRLEEGK